MSSAKKNTGAVQLRQLPDDEAAGSSSSVELHMKPGTTQDDRDMQRLGKTQQLSRSFYSTAVLGLTSTIMLTWQSMFSNGTFSRINGGRAGAVWTFFASWLFTLFPVASMAEMASMAPSSGGQYHWVSEFAPPSCQAVLSYISGWLSALGWQAFIAVAAYGTGQLILICAVVDDPSITTTPWQGTLFTIGVALFAVCFNIFAAKYLPVFEWLILFFHVVGFFVVMIPLWAIAPKVPPREVFGLEGFANYGGWSTLGAACIIGQLSAGGALLGADSAAHMSEEVTNASLTVPRLMFGTIVFNGALGFIAISTYASVIEDLQTQIVESTAAFPWIAVFRQAIGSSAAAIGMTVPIIVVSFGMAINSTAAASRQAWSFARDEGMPFPTWFKRITVVRKTPSPVNATIASLFICICLALLNLGGSEAFNSIIGLMTGAIGMTYTISICCILWRRLYGERLPPSRWSLGRWGVPVNVVAILYEIFTTVISFFPLFNHPTAQSMNWGIAMFGGFALISIVTYIARGRKVYKGPVVDVSKQ